MTFTSNDKQQFNYWFRSILFSSLFFFRRRRRRQVNDLNGPIQLTQCTWIIGNDVNLNIIDDEHIAIDWFYFL